MKKRIALALLLAAAPLQAQEGVQLATFDSVWSIVKRMHFDSTFGGVDWDKVRAELRPQAERARDNAQLRPLLLQMVGRLGKSHYSIFPAQQAENLDGGGQGDVGFDVRYLEKKILVSAVDSTGPAARAGVKPGWELRQVGPRTIEQILERTQRVNGHYAESIKAALVARAALTGPEDSTVVLHFRDGRGRAVEVSVKRRSPPGQVVRLMQLPPMYTQFASREIPQAGGKVGLLWFNVWMVPAMLRFDTAMDKLRMSRGLIIDLRGNPGGAGAMSMGVAGHVLDTAQVFGSMNMRSTRMQFKANPRRVTTQGERVKPFGGPVAVLIDELSGSTSEVFAGGLQSIGRVRVFGTRSMGAVLPAATSKLPNGDVLYHAIADFVTPDGTLLEGRGVIPDEQIEVKRADLLAGRDPVLEAALRWIAAQARAQ